MTLTTLVWVWCSGVTLEYQRQQAKAMQQYFKAKKLDETIEQAKWVWLNIFYAIYVLSSWICIYCDFAGFLGGLRRTRFWMGAGLCLDLQLVCWRSMLQVGRGWHAKNSSVHCMQQVTVLSGSCTPWFAAFFLTIFMSGALQLCLIIGVLCRRKFCGSD